MAIFCKPKPGSELVTACGATENPSIYSPPGVSSGHFILKSAFIGLVTVVMYTIGVGPTSAVNTRKTPAPAQRAALGSIAAGYPM